MNPTTNNSGKYVGQALEGQKQKSRNAQTVKKCEVHGEVMKAMKVSLIYGLPTMDEAFKKLIEDRARLFPNARSHLLGGCFLGLSGPETDALVCLQCRKAEKQWKRETGLPSQPSIGAFIIS